MSQAQYDRSKARLEAIRPDGTPALEPASISEAVVWHMLGYAIDVYMWDGSKYYKRHTILPTDLFK